MNLRREILKGLGVLFLLLLLIMWLSGVFVRKVHPGPAVEKTKPETLKTWKVQKTTYPLLIEQNGTVRGQMEARVSNTFIPPAIRRRQL